MGEGTHRGLYPASSNPLLTDVEEDGAESSGAILSAPRLPRSESRSRPSRKRVDTGRVHGLSSVAKGVAALGVLLVSLIALRFAICFGTLRLHRTSLLDILPGTTPRGLADERVPLLSYDPSDRQLRGDGCSGLLGSSGRNSPPLGPPGAAGDGGVRRQVPRAAATRRLWRETLLRDRTAQLAFTAIAFSVVGLTLYSVYIATGGPRPVEYAMYACLVLAVTALLLELYGIWWERRALRYQPVRQEDVRR